MKLYHITISFALIAFTLIIISDIRTNNLNTVIDNKKEIDGFIDVAIDDAVTRLIEVGENNKIHINKEKAIESFFASLYSSFGILSDREKQQELALYFPVIAVTVEDGYYLYYYDEYNGADDNTYTVRRWSEKLPYYYEDEYFLYGFTLSDTITLLDKYCKLDSSASQKVYQMNYKDVGEKYANVINSSNHFLFDNEKFETLRKTTIASLIENSMAYYISHHNKIASNHGITYNFNLPPISNNQWMPYLDDCSIFVVFQGYPYGNEAGDVYNRFASAGAKISKDTLFFIEQVDWYLLYHKSGCPEINEKNIRFYNESYFTIEECVKEGAYACPKCSALGVYAPDYTAH
ncbi:MAG: hypothetical protein GX359_06395 [Clostridiales bacterium]|nr:hypothetical protein [Clostridiales bacterium]